LPEQRYRIGAIDDVTGRSMLLFERIAARPRRVAGREAIKDTAKAG
jgi:hypothetical protein